MAEAGFGPNKLSEKLDDGVILGKLAVLVRELGRMPLSAELRLRAQSDSSFPSHTVWSRFGRKADLIAAVRRHCEAHTQLVSILPLLPQPNPSPSPADATPKAPRVAIGYVYLMKSGRHYKIGRSNSVGRREWELGIKIPIPPSTIHSIATDDPVGVEGYWHRRFSEKRGEGEWFKLTPDDIAAFKRWKKIA